MRPTARNAPSVKLDVPRFCEGVMATMDVPTYRIDRPSEVSRLAEGFEGPSVARSLVAVWSDEIEGMPARSPRAASDRERRPRSIRWREISSRSSMAMPASAS